MNKTLIPNSLEKAISYSQYRSLIKSLITQEKSTGLVQSDDLLNYSMLNDKRMDRLDKKIVISEETQDSISSLKNNFTFLVIAEGWCGDAAQIMPILNKIAESSSKIELKIVLRDDNPELMDEFLTNGGKAIPKTIIVDSNNKVINSWGPRPSIATQMVQDYKEQNGGLDDEFKKDLQIWYNKDKGANTQEDLIKLLKAA